MTSLSAPPAADPICSSLATRDVAPGASTLSSLRTYFPNPLLGAPLFFLDCFSAMRRIARFFGPLTAACAGTRAVSARLYYDYCHRHRHATATTATTANVAAAAASTAIVSPAPRPCRF